MICTICKNQIPENAVNCDYCGASQPQKVSEKISSQTVIKPEVIDLSEQNNYISVSKIKKRAQPQSLAGLIVGLMALPLMLAYGFPAIIGGIIAIVISRRGKLECEANPNLYSDGSWKMAKAGLNMGIGATIGGAVITIVIVGFVAWLVVVSMGRFH